MPPRSLCLLLTNIKPDKTGVMSEILRIRGDSAVRADSNYAVVWAECPVFYGEDFADLAFDTGPACNTTRK